MTAFTDQYSLPNMFFCYIGQLYIEHTNVKRGASGDIVFKYTHKIISNTLIIVQLTFIYDLRLQDKYNTFALSKHIGKYVHSTRNAEERLGESSPFPPFLNLMHIFPICFDSAQVLYIYPAMTAFTDQYLDCPIFLLDIGQL